MNIYPDTNFSEIYFLIFPGYLSFLLSDAYFWEISPHISWLYSVAGFLMWTFQKYLLIFLAILIVLDLQASVAMSS
jgi:hypothetical protein